MDRDGGVQSIVRGLKVIEALNQGRVTSLEALHRTTGLPKPTLVRLLETLVGAGYVCHVSRREGYAVTGGVLRLSAGVRHRDILVDVARPLMEAFTHQHKWQVSLATREGEAMLIRTTTRHLSPYSREEIFLNRRVGMLVSAVGRAYFAYCSAQDREVLLKIIAESEGPDAADAADPARVDAICRSVRACGYARIRRSRSDPYRSFAAPILSGGDDQLVLGSLVMFWYRSVMTEAAAAERYLGPLTSLAADIAAALERELDRGPGSPARLSA